MKRNKFRYQYMATFSVLLIIISGGMHYAWPSPSIPQYVSGNTTSFQITEDEASWIIIMETISPIPACFLGAIINDIIGRKKTILLTTVPYFVGWILILFATSTVELFIARLLAGVSDGIAFTIISLYVGEIADPNIRGFLAASISTSWIFGMLIINVMGSYLSISLTAAISSVIPILFFMTFIWMPESPYFLLMKKDVDQARLSLKKFTGEDNVEDHLNRLQGAIQYKKKSDILELFTKRSNLKGLAILIIARSSQQLSGITAISFYTLAIFSEAGDFISPFAATLMYASLQCITTCFCSIVIDKIGRRPLLIFSLTGAAVFLFMGGTYFYVKEFTSIDTSSFDFVPLVVLTAFVIIVYLGAQPIPLLLQGELFPTNVKGFACCISEVFFCILASITSKLFQTTRDNFGIHLPFYLFSIGCVINSVFVFMIVPETKGKTLEEIQHVLDGSKVYN